MKRFHIVVLGVLAAGLTATVAVAANVKTGPSSSQSPYVVPVGFPDSVSTQSILTVGDTPSGSDYEMVGVPDGLGAFDNGNGTFTLLMNHELPPTSGVARAHGGTGSFVSRWVIDKGDLEVKSGADLIQQVYLWSGSGYAQTANVQFSRFCSADLPAPGAFRSGGLGYDGRIFLNGEETGAEGRAFAHVVTGAETGRTYELPALGKFSWENSVAHPDTGTTTVVVGTDDAGDGQLYVYVGQKTSTGSAVRKAGLTGGTLYGVKVAGLGQETDGSSTAAASFTAVSLGDVTAKSGATLEADSDAAGVTGFNRPEDGAWDPSRPSDFYFATTASINGKSRLWRLRFVDPANPALGGTAEAVLDGSEGQHMLDNLTIDDRGHVLLQEDPGSSNPTGVTNYLAKLWAYDIASDELVELAEHDPARFTPGLPGFLTADEESSGIIPAPFLGEGRFLLDVQAHYAIPGALVQGGQLLVLHVPPGQLNRVFR